MTAATNPQNLPQLLQWLWEDYLSITPIAKKVQNLFAAKGEQLCNDHIALRTFRHPDLGLEAMEQTFTRLGYVAKNDYHFKEKKLYAKHFEHPAPNAPKVFISELKTEELSAAAQKIIQTYINSALEQLRRAPILCLAGRPWTPSFSDYQALAKESEYASWVIAHGFKVNHFTVLVNELKQFQSLEQVNSYLEAAGITLNSSGGKIKGTPAELLEQSSTLASLIPVTFSEGPQEIPSCYYEFAKRYPQKSTGTLYQGFIAASADKIFESTNRGQSS